MEFGSAFGVAIRWCLGRCLVGDWVVERNWDVLAVGLGCARRGFAAMGLGFARSGSAVGLFFLSGGFCSQPFSSVVVVVVVAMG